MKPRRTLPAEKVEKEFSQQRRYPVWGAVLRLRPGVLNELSALKPWRGQAGQTAQKEKNYFAGQARRMNYKEIADRGWPIGSGAVESNCRQDQCRFKRVG